MNMKRVIYLRSAERSSGLRNDDLVSDSLYFFGIVAESEGLGIVVCNRLLRG